METMKEYIGIVKWEQYPGKGTIVVCYESLISAYHYTCYDNDERKNIVVIPKHEIEIIGEI